MSARGRGSGGLPPPSGPSAEDRYETAKNQADDRAEKQLSNDLNQAHHSTS